MITKVRSRSLALAAVSVAVGLGSHQALAASQTGHASAQIVQAISISENTQMAFGFVIPPAGAANVVLSTGGVPSGAGFTFQGGAAAGNFTAHGTATEPAIITFSSGDTLVGPAGSTPMALDTYTTDAGASPVFQAGNVLTFNVGATLHVGAAQMAGPYSGTYTVTVNY
jgi:Mat/Ecp fimbriae major subunit